MMFDAPFPSGKEMHHLTEMNSDLADVLDQRKNGKKTNRSSANKYVPSRNRSYGAVRQEMIQASINCIQKRLESNNIEDVVKKFLSASCAEELAEPIRNLADYIPDIELNQAFHESYELDHFLVDLHHFATNNEAPMMSYIASVLLVVTPDSMRVERLVSLYNDVKTIRRSGLSEETVNDVLQSRSSPLV